MSHLCRGTRSHAGRLLGARLSLRLSLWRFRCLPYLTAEAPHVQAHVGVCECLRRCLPSLAFIKPCQVLSQVFYLYPHVRLTTL